MKKEDRNELIVNAASKVHEVWCEGELKAYYERFAEAIKTAKTYKRALYEACYKNNKRRNYVEFLDPVFLDFHELWVSELYKTFNGFKHLIKLGCFSVKRFVKRNLAEEEITKMGFDYNPKTQEENILRPFCDLSTDSQKENLSAAFGAVAVYEEYMKRGFTREQLGSEQLKAEIGTLIHTDWMRRNEITNSNKHLFVPYSELDDWTKQQDLDVFYAILEEVNKNPEKYMVEKEDGLGEFDVIAAEKAIIETKLSNLKLIETNNTPKKKKKWLIF